MCYIISFFLFHQVEAMAVFLWTIGIISGNEFQKNLLDPFYRGMFYKCWIYTERVSWIKKKCVEFYVAFNFRHPFIVNCSSSLVTLVQNHLCLKFNASGNVIME